MTVEPVTLRRARYAVTAVFAIHGAVTATFATRIPWLQDRLHLGPTALGAAMVAPAVSACFTMPLAGRVIRRFGSPAAVWGLSALFAVTLILPALAPSLPTLWLALLAFGGAGGIADVVMNANGSDVERLYGRSIMSSLHAAWSAGGLVSSALGALAVYAGLDARTHFALVAAVLATTSVWAGRSILEPPASRNAPRSSGFALPERAVLAIGMVGFCAQFAQGATANWSGVYLRGVVHTGAAVAALSLTVFNLAMGLTRVFGDLAIRRWGPKHTTMGLGAVSVVGCAIVTLARDPVTSMAGIALLGVGIAVIVPMAFAAAGRREGDVSRAVASVATVTYLSNLVAPAAVGAIAGASSLPASFAAITGLLVAMTLGAGAFGPAPSGTAMPPATDPREVASPAS